MVKLVNGDLQNQNEKLIPIEQLTTKSKTTSSLSIPLNQKIRSTYYKGYLQLEQHQYQ